MVVLFFCLSSSSRRRWMHFEHCLRSIIHYWTCKVEWQRKTCSEHKITQFWVMKWSWNATKSREKYHSVVNSMPPMPQMAQANILEGRTILSECLFEATLQGCEHRIWTTNRWHNFAKTLRKDCSAFQNVRLGGVKVGCNQIPKALDHLLCCHRRSYLRFHATLRPRGRRGLKARSFCSPQCSEWIRMRVRTLCSKRRFWKDEQKMKSWFSNELSIFLGPNRVLTPLKSASNILISSFVHPSKIFVWEG